MKLLLITLALLANTVANTAALAHTDEYLDTQKTPNGGQMRMAGLYHFELLAKNGQDVVVFVTDHAGTKISTTGASGTATILSGKSKTTLTLTPDGDNRLKGIGKYAATPDMKVVTSLVIAGKPAEQARFTPLATQKAASPATQATSAELGHHH
ncbi:MAG: hypothetical protein Q8O31_04975 [Rhodocyclaceae bacterium]|nr:hypothetical protein [Rhodocyclaceae bacterium]